MTGAPDSALDLKNPIIAKMVEWIEHPLEFNRRPESISIVASRDLFCPTQEVEECHLLKFTMDGGEEYIGFTGPITWCFLDIDFNALSPDDLFLRYIGWYVAFGYYNQEDYDKSKEASNWQKVLAKQTKKGYGEISILQNLYMANENYYELSAIKNGKEVRLVGTEKNMGECPKDYILPFYEFIGEIWSPFDI
jgi:hypothetical protein